METTDVVVISTNLIVFPMPDIKCWFLQCLNGLLRQRVLHRPDKYIKIRSKLEAEMQKLASVHSTESAHNPPGHTVPLDNWGRPVWE